MSYKLKEIAYHWTFQKSMVYKMKQGALHNMVHVVQRNPVNMTTFGP